jgi:hypothetical protein
MERDRFTCTMILGAFIHGALALGGLMFFSAQTGNKWAGLLAIAGAGLAYACQVLMANGMVAPAGLVALCSVVAGVCSFVLLAL